MMNLETKIDNFKALDQQIKALTAQRDAIKKEMISEYFMDHESYVTEDGRLLATYKAQIRVVLDQKALKEEYPELVDQYSNLQEVKVFLAK